MDRRNGRIGNVAWYVVIGVTFIMLAYCAFPAIDRYESRNTKELTMLEFIQDILAKNGMEMERDKTYTYDFNSNRLIVNKKGD